MYYRTARKYYDNREYAQSYELCERAFLQRPQLTNEGSIEVLRIQGLAAARLGNRKGFDSVIGDFASLDETKKSQRIKLFLSGFNSRLDGLYDEALVSLRQAYDSDGQNDYHILRELSNIYMLMGDLKNAKKFIDIAKTKSYMQNNTFILDIEIKTMLAGDKKSVEYNSSEINDCIDKLRAIDGGNFSKLLKTEFDMVLSDENGASEIANAIDTGSPSGSLLKSKALIRARKFNDAEKILTDLIKEVSKSKKGQRMSIFPVVVLYLIDVTSVRSVGDAIDVFKKYFKFVPHHNREKIKRDLSSAVTEKTKLTSEQKRVISFPY